MASVHRRLALGLIAGMAGLGMGASALAGPDVVVSTIGPTFSKYGTTGGISGYAVTTVSCNIGDAVAEWFQFTPDHPVIGTQLYRLHNGRFEQIGMNWLKHGWCAADAPNCLNLDPNPGDGNDSYLPNGSCDWLGRFATDTYSASLNADQLDCGPRSEVNASTGVYPYPYQLGWNQTGNCVYKRLQVANADLNPANYPGARYFGEVHYVTTDEHSSVRHNNASYREVVVGSLSASSGGSGCTETGYNLSFTGATIPLKPAIEAWKAIDPSVTLVPVNIRDDGRVIVGAKVTDLGNGQWAYEYAVYNHNSHRSIQAFSIPKPAEASATFTNLGFHDVAYHSGEPYSGADWEGSVTSDAIEWATETFAQNPNANAIRWGTTYNFRFQSNRAPVTGSATLTLFRPASPATVEVDGLPVPDATPSFCPADFNQSGGAPTVQDIFDFLAAYFNNDPAADFNGVSGLSVQDIFDFLASYFSPCA